MVARAVENTTFFIYSNLIGTEKNLVYWGGNAVVGPRGEVKAKGTYFKEDNVECEIDLTELEVARQFRPTLRDTRVEVFDAIQDIYKVKWSKGK
jgi:N-carbamoylputrescine amidase